VAIFFPILPAKKSRYAWKTFIPRVNIFELESEVTEGTAGKPIAELELELPSQGPNNFSRVFARLGSETTSSKDGTPSNLSRCRLLISTA